MALITTISGHIVLKILIQYPIELFSLAIGLQVKRFTKLKLAPSFFHKKCQKFQHKIGISIIYDDFSMPWCLTHMSKNSVIFYAMVVVVLVGPNLINFENLYTTTKPLFPPTKRDMS